MLSFKELKRNTKKDTGSLPTIRVALVGDTATQFLATAIRGWGIEIGYAIELYEAEYNQVERQLLDMSSELYQFNAQYVIVYQSSHKWNERYSMLSADRQISLADERLAFVRDICSSAQSNIVYFNYAEIDDSVFGSYANKVESSFVYQIRKFNYELMRLAEIQPNLFICDIAGLQSKLGRNFMFDPMVYMTTEMILSIDAVPYVASRVMDVIAALQGKFKKCIILDLDNTVWGGVIGDDGIEGIQLGHLGIGKAFTEFQMWVKKLKQRGIIVCVASKNNEETAKEPFEKHPDMVLKLEDIAVFQANWETKVDNIRTIQSILNIGLDSMVFLDDNPFERNIVQESIPGITVPELPEDPAEYLEYLYSLNLFETASYSNMDKDRTKQYQAESKRMSFSRTFANEADFLKSLNMTSIVEDFTTFNTPRVAQLSQRSNQFNLRTVRYTEEQISSIQKKHKQKGFAFSLKDKFGDNGLIAVVILDELNRDTVFIDTWFMSCRVLKRGMEYFTLNTIVEWAKENGYKKMIGEYLPTPKNGMVAEFYTSLGFTKTNNTNPQRWSLLLTDYVARECYIKNEN